MRRIDRKRVQRAFDRQAGFYEETVVVQKRVIKLITRRLEGVSETFVPKRILDIGAGTGMLLKAAGSIWPDVSAVGLDLAPGMGRVAMNNLRGRGAVHFVEGDAEHVPFANESFDLVLSTSTLQWLDVLETVFSEVYRVLVPGGRFQFALFGEGTLHELCWSYRRALHPAERDLENRLHRFHSQRQVESSLSSVGFSGITVESFCEKEYYQHVPGLLRSLRKIGAGNASPVGRQGLGGRTVMMKMMDVYCVEFSEAGRIPATYEVIVGQGIKS